MLIAAGMTRRETPELWNIEQPAAIATIHKSYFDAGADVVLTNTFGGTELKLQSTGQADLAFEFNEAAVKNARSVCPVDKFVAGDIGPTGQFLPPVGSVTEMQLFNAFSAQAKTLVECGVDLIVIETMYDIREAIQAIQAVRAHDKSVPIIATMTFEKKKRGFFTMMGNKPADCLIALENAGADVVGANCSLESSEMIDLYREIKTASSLPMAFQPNAGQPDVRGSTVCYPQTPQEFAQDIAELVNMGASIVGGCCGTNPEFIRLAREAIEKDRNG